MFGVIDESHLTLISARPVITGTETEDIDEAFQHARRAIVEDGLPNVSIVKARYHGEDPNGTWVEDLRHEPIRIDAEHATWAFKLLQST